MLAVGCWLLVGDCGRWLLALGCWLLAVGRSFRLAVGCWLLGSASSSPPRAAHVAMARRARIRAPPPPHSERNARFVSRARRRRARRARRTRRRGLAAAPVRAGGRARRPASSRLWREDLTRRASGRRERSDATRVRAFGEIRRGARQGVGRYLTRRASGRRESVSSTGESVSSPRRAPVAWVATRDEFRPLGLRSEASGVPIARRRETSATTVVASAARQERISRRREGSVGAHLSSPRRKLRSDSLVAAKEA